MHLRDSWLKEAAACQSHDLDDSFAAEHAALCDAWLASRPHVPEPLRGLRPEEAKVCDAFETANRLAAERVKPFGKAVEIAERMRTSPPTDGVVLTAEQLSAIEFGYVHLEQNADDAENSSMLTRLRQKNIDQWRKAAKVLRALSAGEK